MSQPEPKLLSFPKGTRQPQRRPRDPRIDAFRGLALVMIFIDHMPGNPYEHYTLRNWGFSDAAEAFFDSVCVATSAAAPRRAAPPCERPPAARRLRHVSVTPSPRKKLLL